MSAVDPSRESRRARVLIPLGTLVTLGAAGTFLYGLLSVLDSGGSEALTTLIVSSVALFPGILMLVAGFQSRSTARFASEGQLPFASAPWPGTGRVSGAPGQGAGMGGVPCPRCGNLTPLGTAACATCGHKLA